MAVKTNKQINVMIAAGGSGGHIFPAIAVAESLRSYDNVNDIVFVASKRSLDRHILKGFNGKTYYLSINPMPYGRKIIPWIAFAAKNLADFIVSLYLILRFRPDIVLGFGGYSSGAFSLCSKLMGVPVIIHEQNITLGRANRILSKYADKIAVSFKDTMDHIDDGFKGKVVFTGNPIRKFNEHIDKNTIYEKFGLDKNKKTILVIGGSQGSSFINNIISGAAKIISDKYGSKIQFFHITGKKDHDLLKRFYGKHNINGEVFSFIDDIYDAYSIADIAVSRSGAAAIFELACCGIPMILIPYPNPRNSQHANAEYFHKKGAAISLKERDISQEKLSDIICGILHDQDVRNSMYRSAKNLSVRDSADLLAGLVVNEAAKGAK